MGVFDAADGKINLAASTNKMFKAFCEVMNVPELAEDERYRSARGRVEHRHALWETMNAITSEVPTKELVEKMNAAGCPCGPIYNIGEAFEDEQVKFLKMAKPVTHKALGEFELVRTPISMSAFQESERFERAAPEPGEHADEILKEMGLSDDDIEQLRASHVI